MAPRTPRRNVPAAVPQGEVIADFTAYTEAVAYVEKLVVNNFPAGFIAIVGTDLRTVERVRGKLSYARVALQGAITGSWMGLIVSFVIGDQGSTTGGLGSPMAADIFIGAGLGMLFNIVRFSMMRSKKQFISQSSVVAMKYQVQVPQSLVGQALAAANKAQEPTA